MLVENKNRICIRSTLDHIQKSVLPHRNTRNGSYRPTRIVRMQREMLFFKGQAWRKTNVSYECNVSDTRALCLQLIADASDD